METVQGIVKLHDLKFKTYLEETLILERVRLIAEQINGEYADKKPLLVAIMNGSFMFAADLMRSLCIDCEISFIKASSYSGTQSTETINVSIGPGDELKDRHVIIVEDIVDSGHSLEKLLPIIKTKMPSSVKIASLLYKPKAFKGSFTVDYVGFEIPNDFIVGYGLDYDGLGRNLRDIYVLAQ